jgi:ABC-2 type transport system ATP-binding protein
VDSERGGVGAAIVADGLTRSFSGQLALDGLTLDAQPGEVLAVLGPNGAGKTTTVRLLNGVLAPDSGSSRVLGLDPAREGNEVRRRTGVLTENAGLDDRLTAWENLVITGRIRGMSTADAGAKATAMLERFGMADRADDRVQGFSTGQRKRVAIGRALLHDPDILFLDEPTSGLDPEATRDVIDLIGSLATEHRRTVVLCTHFLGEAGRLAHRMAVLDRGRLLAFGTPAELARAIWKGLDVALDLGAAADEMLVETLSTSKGVLAARATDIGAHLTVTDRSVIPLVVAALTSREIPVFGAVPMPPTLEDVYFAVVNENSKNANPKADP